MKTQITFLKIILPALLVWVHVMSSYSQTTDVISVKTADVAKFTDTHKQWRFEAVNYRMFNTVAGKYLTGHADGTVTLEAKDETATAANQYWSINELHSGHIALRNKGTGLSANSYRSDLQFVFSSDAEAQGTTTLPVNLTTANGPGGALMKLDAVTLIPVPGTSYTINTISWYTRSIVANSGNITVEAVDNNDGTAYAQWQFEEVESDPSYPVMSYNKRIYNTKAAKYLASVNNAGTYSTVLAPIDNTVTANLQYWTIVTGNYGAIMFRNYGAGGINDLNQGLTGADLVAGGTHEVNLTTANGPGSALLQLDDNSVKVPVPGTDYSIQSISWYLRSLISTVVDNSGGNLSATSLSDSELENSILKVNSGELVVDASKTLKSIQVAAGAKLTLNNGIALTATNGITLQSDATGTATLKSSGTYSGTITAQQYLGTARNWYVSSPVSSASAPATNMDYYYEYMEGGNNTEFVTQPGSSSLYWKGLANGTTMEVGKGYIAKANEGTTISFTGTPNNGSITTEFDLTRNDAKGKGFNLAGNPYPSYIDWADVATANPNLDNTYYYRTKNIDNSYAFVTWNGAGNEYVNSRGGTANTTITRFIPPTQAFWVRVKTGTSTTKMYFNNDMREHRDDNGNLMKAPRQDTRTSVRLQLINGTERDELLIYQDAGASNNYDSYDSPKMMNNSTTVPDLYSIVGDERLVINGLNAITENMELPLGFTLKSAAMLKMKATELNNLAEGMQVYLLDKTANTQTQLTPETDYSFTTTEANTNNESRFSLLFKAPGATTGIGESNQDKERISVFVNTQNELVIIAPENSRYAVYTMVGQQLEAGLVTTGVVRLSSVSKGVYLVKISNQTVKITLR